MRIPVAQLLALLLVPSAMLAQASGKWTPVPPDGPDSSPDYSWEKNSDSGCLRPTDNAYGTRLEALGKLLFGAASTATAGCVTGVYLENGYSAQIPQMANHAGIDFRAMDGTTRVYSPVSGKVVLASLDPKAGTSTLTIRSDDDAYNVLLLHCSSHEHRRNGLPVPALKEGIAVRKGDQICIAGSIGAAAPHLHVEVKRMGQDAGRLKAMFGGQGACKKSQCTLTDVRANTVDPTSLVAGAGTPSGSGNSQAPAYGTGAPSAAVRDDQAQFTFTIKTQRVWEWCDGGGAGMPYGWNVKVANGKSRYEFGFSMFSTQGAGRCHKGSFEELLAGGQFTAWKVTGDGGLPIQGVQVRHAISDGGKLLHIVLNDRKTIHLLFSAKPKTVAFESVVDSQKTTVSVPVLYTAPRTSDYTPATSCQTVSLSAFYSQKSGSISADLNCDGKPEKLSVREALQQQDPYFLVIEQLIVSDVRGKTIWKSPTSESYSGPAPHLTSTEHHSTRAILIGDIDGDGKNELLVSTGQTLEENSETSWDTFRWNGKAFAQVLGQRLLREISTGSGKFVWTQYKDAQPGITWVESLDTNGSNLIAGIKGIDSKWRVSIGEAIVSFDKNGLHVVRWLKPLKKVQ